MRLCRVLDTQQIRIFEISDPFSYIINLNLANFVLKNSATVRRFCMWFGRKTKFISSSTFLFTICLPLCLN